jgi:hypothetical protein
MSLRAALFLLLFFTFSWLSATNNGPLNVKYFQILKYRVAKDSAWQEPPRVYSILFQGTPTKGWIEMNSHRSFNAQWEIASTTNKGNITFSNTGTSDYYVTRHEWIQENFEIAMAQLFPKFSTYDKQGDTLRFGGEADMLLVQVNSLRQRVEATWINDKDSNNVLEFRNGKCFWMTIHGKDTSRTVYDYYAEDDREMEPGNWNLVCDYLELSNPDTTFSFDVINAGSNLWLSEREDNSGGFSFTRSDVLKMEKLHAADRDSIEKICERNIGKLFLGPTNRKNALKELTPPENVFAEFEFAHQDSSNEKQSLEEITTNIHSLYADSLLREMDSTTMEMRRAHFRIAKDSAVWSTWSSFIDDGDRHVATVRITLDAQEEGGVAFEVETQFILLEGRWYMLPHIQRYDVSHYH